MFGGDREEVADELEERVERLEEIQEEEFKGIAKEAWMEAWGRARGVEDVDDITMKLAENKFERWWELNHQ